MSDQTPTVVALRPDQMEEVIRHLAHGGAVGEHMGERMLAFVAAAQAREEAHAKDAARYRILRGTGETQSAYGPEEEGIWGGKELDDYCDAKLAASSPPREEPPTK